MPEGVRVDTQASLDDAYFPAPSEYDPQLSVERNGGTFCVPRN